MAQADAPESDEFDPRLYAAIGNIASDWSLLEYLVNRCIWRVANIEHDQLGACITAQIPTLPARLEALVLLCKERGISNKLRTKLNKFHADHRLLVEARNRAVHDPIGKENSKYAQLQITARGKSVFDLGEVTLTKLITDRDRINAYVHRFSDLMSDILRELPALPYRPKIVFPQITHYRV